MIAIIFLFIDFLCAALFQEWLVYSTLAYLIASIITLRQPEKKATFWITVNAFLLLDFAIYGRFGLGLIYFLFVLFAIRVLKTALLKGDKALFFACLTLYFVMENALWFNLLMYQPQPFLVTTIKIFINLVVGYVTLWGMQGNRSLRPVSVIRGRKVWTPSRKDAS